VKYKKYPCYKDSGVEWLGEIPEDWTSLSLKNLLCKIIDNRGRTPNFGDSGIPMLEIRNITKGIKTPTLEFEKYVLEDIVKEYERDKVKIGDLLISTVGATSGKTVIIQEEPNYFIAQNIVGLRVNSFTVSEYLYYFLCSDYFYTSLMLINKGNTIDNLKVSVFINNKCFLPPLQEQQSIANYLDKATAKIDTLIEKQTKLIELLHEKGQALISTAVTRGLDNTVPMKDSGIEWLGEIPEHWENYRIDWVSAIIRGNTGFKKDELLSSGEYVALQYGKTYKVDEVDETFNFYVNSEFYKSSQVVHYGDTILISTSETVEDLGHSCFYNRSDLGLIGGEQILLKSNAKFMFDKYLYFYSKVFSNELRRYATGLKVFRFNINDLKNIFISLPPKEEQKTIATFLDEKIAKINTLISKSTKAIELLKERRTALISAVVTGKIDVREFDE